MKARLTVTLAVLAVLGWFAPVGANQSFTYYGTTVGGPQFVRPSATFTVGTTITTYQTQTFQVNLPVTCIVQGVQNGNNGANKDGWIHVYQGTFNPLTPTANGVAANDDDSATGLGIGSSRTATFAAIANTPYIVVTSANGAGTEFDFQNFVSCKTNAGPLTVISHGDCGGTSNNTQACVSNNRFRVSATFATPPGGTPTGQAQVVQYGTGDSALFTFFSAQNIELLVKVLNFCPFAENAWRVFAAGTTTAGVVVTVNDTLRGGSVQITNPLNSAFQNVVVPIPGSCP